MGHKMLSESINSTKTGISISLLCFGPFWPFEVHQKRSAIFCLTIIAFTKIAKNGYVVIFLILDVF